MFGEHFITADEYAEIYIDPVCRFGDEDGSYTLGVIVSDSEMICFENPAQDAGFIAVEVCHSRLSANDGGANCNICGAVFVCMCIRFR